MTREGSLGAMTKGPMPEMLNDRVGPPGRVRVQDRLQRDRTRGEIFVTVNTEEKRTDHERCIAPASGSQDAQRVRVQPHGQSEKARQRAQGPGCGAAPAAPVLRRGPRFSGRARIAAKTELERAAARDEQSWDDLPRGAPRSRRGRSTLGPLLCAKPPNTSVFKCRHALRRRLETEHMDRAILEGEVPVWAWHGAREVARSDRGDREACRPIERRPGRCLAGVSGACTGPRRGRQRTPRAMACRGVVPVHNPGQSPGRPEFEETGSWRKHRGPRHPASRPVVPPCTDEIGQANPAVDLAASIAVSDHPISSHRSARKGRRGIASEQAQAIAARRSDDDIECHPHRQSPCSKLRGIGRGNSPRG